MEGKGSADYLCNAKDAEDFLNIKQEIFDDFEPDCLGELNDYSLERTDVFCTDQSKTKSQLNKEHLLIDHDYCSGTIYDKSDFDRAAPIGHSVSQWDNLSEVKQETFSSAEDFDVSNDDSFNRGTDNACLYPLKSEDIAELLCDDHNYCMGSEDYAIKAEMGKETVNEHALKVDCGTTEDNSDRVIENRSVTFSARSNRRISRPKRFDDYCTDGIDAVDSVQVVINSEKDEYTSDAALKKDGRIRGGLENHPSAQTSELRHQTLPFAQNRQSCLTKQSLERRFPCKFCDKTFTTRQNQQFHEMKHTGEQHYLCVTCGKRFIRKVSYLAHIRAHKNTVNADKTFASTDKTLPSKQSQQHRLKRHTGERSYTCYSCEKTFTTKNSLRIHLIRSGDETFTCSFCDKTFPTKQCLWKHTNTHLSDNSSTCHICHKTFSNKFQLKVHIWRHAGIKPHPCKFCDKSFTTEGDLKKHVLTHIGDKKFACDLCEKTFLLKMHLILHVRIHSGQKPYVCHLCDKRFIRKVSYLAHIRAHKSTVDVDKTFASSRDKPFACNFCGKTFKTKAHMQYHIFLHTGENRFSCDRCDAKFKTKQLLLRHHAMRHTSQTQNLFLCDVCGKCFASQGSLNYHKSRHLGLNLCNVCGRGYTTKQFLRSHIKQHTSERPFICDICYRPKTFKSKQDIRAHIEAHLATRFTCDFCDKAFFEKRLLLKHVKKHLVVKSFDCDFCNAKFITRAGALKHITLHTEGTVYPCGFCDEIFHLMPMLRLHLRTHPGQGPHACNFCEKNFVLKGNLNRHLRIHSGNRPYKCEFCDKCFITNQQLKSHLSTHTGIKHHVCKICFKGFCNKKPLMLHLQKMHP